MRIKMNTKLCLLSRGGSFCLREHVFVRVPDAEPVDDHVDHRYEEDDDDDHIVQDVGGALARLLVNVHPSDNEEEDADHELRSRSQIAIMSSYS